MLATLRTKKKLVITIAVVVVIAAVITGFMLANRNQPVAAGQSIVVTVTADSLEDVYGYQFHMNYDKAQLEYSETIASQIDDIKTIFSKQMDGYELVGATMIGNLEGVSGNNRAVCEMVFTAKKDSTLHDLSLSISEINVVNVVDGELAYTEDIQGWKVKTAVAPSAE